LNLLQDSSYTLKEVPLQAEDIFFIYTDGVNEAVNDLSEMFEISGLQNAMKEVTSEPADRIVEHIKGKLKAFTGKSSQTDDIVMIAIKVGHLALNT
jgi:sigma-B regulation protein RsbU (phosphoserine phosphatase)